MSKAVQEAHSGGADYLYMCQVSALFSSADYSFLTKIPQDSKGWQGQVAFIAHRLLQLTPPFEISYPPLFCTSHQLLPSSSHPEKSNLCRFVVQERFLIGVQMWVFQERDTPHRWYRAHTCA